MDFFASFHVLSDSFLQCRDKPQKEVMLIHFRLTGIIKCVSHCTKYTLYKEYFQYHIVQLEKGFSETFGRLPPNR